MGAITTTAEKLTEANIVTNMSLTTESMRDPADDTGESELYRAVLRLDIERDAFDITAMGPPTDDLISRASINCRFNETEAIEIRPLTSDGTVYEFKLISQTFTPKNQRGSKFFNLAQGYISVTPWKALSWG